MHYGYIETKPPLELESKLMKFQENYNSLVSVKLNEDKLGLMIELRMNKRENSISVRTEYNKIDLCW